MIKGRFLAVISRLSTEWMVSFTLRMTSLPSNATNQCNIIQLTKGSSFAETLVLGDRTPAVFLIKSRDKFSITSAINNNPNFAIKVEANGLAVNVPIQVEVHQRYTSGGSYRFFIVINGEEVFSIINNHAQQFYDIKVYASNRWANPCPGFIKNFEITNFL